MRAVTAPLALLAAAALACGPTGAVDPEGGRPNVVLVILDDVGLDALSLYEGDSIHRADLSAQVPHAYPRTPNLEALAAQGVRFTQARTNPTCSASRASILTGSYAFRHGIGGLVRPSTAGPFSDSETLELGVGPGNEVTTLAHLARSAGYQALFCGKYHLALLADREALGGRPGYGWDHVKEVAGFDRYWVVWDNLPVQPPPEPWRDPTGREYPPGYYGFIACQDGVVEQRRGEYATVVECDEALELVRAASEPWFLVLSLSAAHSPYDLPPEELVATRHYLDRAAQVLAARSAHDVSVAVPSVWPFYNAMLEAADVQLGRLIGELERTGAHERTVFIVIGDNGTPNRVVEGALEREDLPVGKVTSQLVRDEIERFKHSVWEPGVRVPLIVSGPLVAGPGRKSDVLVDATDLFATLRELLEVPPEALPPASGPDSVSFLPVLRSPAASGQRSFAYVERFQPNGDPRTIRYEPGGMSASYQWRQGFVLETEEGRFKLVRNLDEDGDPADKLFQLTGPAGEPLDPWELRPLDCGLGENQERLAALRVALAALLESKVGQH